jgi:hypothetical protein
MPGPQGPEATNKTAGNEPIPVSKQNTATTVLGDTEKIASTVVEATAKLTPPAGYNPYNDAGF